MSRMGSLYFPESALELIEHELANISAGYEIDDSGDKNFISFDFEMDDSGISTEDYMRSVTNILLDNKVPYDLWAEGDGRGYEEADGFFAAYRPDVPKEQQYFRVYNGRDTIEKEVLRKLYELAGSENVTLADLRQEIKQAIEADEPVTPLSEAIEQSELWNPAYKVDIEQERSQGVFKQAGGYKADAHAWTQLQHEVMASPDVNTTLAVVKDWGRDVLAFRFLNELNLHLTAYQQPAGSIAVEERATFDLSWPNGLSLQEDYPAGRNYRRDLMDCGLDYPLDKLLNMNYETFVEYTEDGLQKLVKTCLRDKAWAERHPMVEKSIDNLHREAAEKRAFAVDSGTDMGKVKVEQFKAERVQETIATNEETVAMVKNEIIKDGESIGYGNGFTDKYGVYYTLEGELKNYPKPGEPQEDNPDYHLWLDAYTCGRPTQVHSLGYGVYDPDDFEYEVLELDQDTAGPLADLSYEKLRPAIEEAIARFQQEHYADIERDLGEAWGETTENFFSQVKPVHNRQETVTDETVNKAASFNSASDAFRAAYDAFRKAGVASGLTAECVNKRALGILQDANLKEKQASLTCQH